MVLVLGEIYLIKILPIFILNVTEIEAILQKAIENVDVRMMTCKRSHDGHSNNIVFHAEIAEIYFSL